MKYLLLLFTLLFSFIANSQPCGSTFGTAIPNTSPNQSLYWVNVYYHIVRASDQSGGYSSSQLCNITTHLNQNFNKYGLYFNATGFDFIDNDNLYNLTPLSDPFAVNAVSNVINIYLVNSYGSGNLAGCAQNIPSSALWVVNHNIFDNTLIHEVGHCLGLYHAHRGTPFGLNKEVGSNICEENIDRSNCTSCGDYICDTPTSPDLVGAVNNDCSYNNPDGWNQNGIPFSPDTHNLMSYSVCRDRFTTQQVYAMKNTLAGSMSNLVNNNLAIPFINGPDNVCSSATLTCPNIVSGYSISSWTSSDQSIASIGGDGTLTKSNDGLITATVTLTQGCTSYYAYKSIYVGLPVPLTGFYVYENYTYPISSPSTGISISNSGQSIYINVSETDPSASFTWATTNQSGSQSFYAGSNTATLTLQGGSSRDITCYATNVCGAGPTTTFNCYNYSGGYRMSAYPNPANDNMMITATSSQENKNQESAESSKDDNSVLTTDDLSKVDVTLLDEDNKAVLNGKFSNNKLNLDTQKIPNGTYYLHMGDEKNKVSLQIIIQH